jgi:hypothetical protein
MTLPFGKMVSPSLLIEVYRSPAGADAIQAFLLESLSFVEHEKATIITNRISRLIRKINC